MKYRKGSTKLFSYQVRTNICGTFYIRKRTREQETEKFEFKQ